MVRRYCDRCGKCISDGQTSARREVHIAISAQHLGAPIDHRAEVCADCWRTVKEALRDLFRFEPPVGDTVAPETKAAAQALDEEERGW
jgi:hypothetical protein